MFLGVIVAVAAILLGGLTEMSVGVIAIFVLAGAVFFAFVLNDGKNRGSGR